MDFLEYPMTRPVHMQRNCTLLLVLLGAIYVTVITLLNIAAVAYELVPVTTTSYNGSNTLWYERVFPSSTSWVPPSRKCDGSVIRFLEG